jgi:hypothetical protein
VGTLAFFPWMTVEERVVLGDVVLVPYEPPPTPSETDPVAKIVSTFKDMNRRTIPSATLVQMTGKGLTDDLTDEEIDLVFKHAVAIAFSALATRRFFGHVGYVNSDSLQCVVQRFTDANFVSVWARRRDGTLQNAIPTSLYQVDREPHIGRLDHQQIDSQLVDAVLKGMSEDSDFDLAIRHFVNANTDRPNLGPADEVVSTVSAFQRLFKVAGGSNTDKKSRDAFLKALGEIPAQEPILNRREVPREKLRSRRGLRDVWMEDLCVVRGSLAHGHREGAYRSFWSRIEHLLLAAFVFPLVAKLRLRDLALYALRPEDEEGLHGIDHLIGAKALLKTGEDEGGMPIYGWLEALDRADDQRRRAAIQQIWQAPQGS